MDNRTNEKSLSVRERLVWWKYPPQTGDTETDIEWGYLVFYSDGRFAFIDQRPPERDIKERRHCLLSKHDTA